MSILEFIVSLVLLCTTPVAAQCLSERASRQLDEYLDSIIDPSTVPGAVAVVVTAEDVLYHHACGQQDVERNIEMHEDSIFRIASMTKPITSLALMQLVENGAVSLDDPVTKFVPSVAKIPINGQDDNEPHQETITVRQLLTHTAGFGYWFCHPDLAAVRRETDTNAEMSLRVHQPGERWTYGCNTRVLGQLIERVTGCRLDAYFNDHIFTQLGMSDTEFHLPKEKMHRLVTVHARNEASLQEQANQENEEVSVFGDYGLRSTAMDYAKFLQVFLNGGRFENGIVLKPETIQQMTSNQIGDLVVQEQPGLFQSMSRSFPIGAGKDKFGFGFQITVQCDDSFRSVGSYSWAGLYNTFFWVDPQARIAVVLFMQQLPFYDEYAIQLLRGFEQQLYMKLE